MGLGNAWRLSGVFRCGVGSVVAWRLSGVLKCGVGQCLEAVRSVEVWGWAMLGGCQECLGVGLGNAWRLSGVLRCGVGSVVEQCLEAVRSV